MVLGRTDSSFRPVEEDVRVKLFLAQTRKAIGTLVVGVYGWATYVVTSEPGRVTAEEWLALGGVGVAVAAVYGLTNDPALPAEPPAQAPAPLAPRFDA